MRAVDCTDGTGGPSQENEDYGSGFSTIDMVSVGVVSTGAGYYTPKYSKTRDNVNCIISSPNETSLRIERCPKLWDYCVKINETFSDCNYSFIYRGCSSQFNSDLQESNQSNQHHVFPYFPSVSINGPCSTKESVIVRANQPDIIKTVIYCLCSPDYCNSSTAISSSLIMIMVFMIMAASIRGNNNQISYTTVFQVCSVLLLLFCFMSEAKRVEGQFPGIRRGGVYGGVMGYSPKKTESISCYTSCPSCTATSYIGCERPNNCLKVVETSLRGTEVWKGCSSSRYLFPEEDKGLVTVKEEEEDICFQTNKSVLNERNMKSVTYCLCSDHYCNASSSLSINWVAKVILVVNLSMCFRK